MQLDHLALCLVGAMPSVIICTISRPVDMSFGFHLDHGAAAGPAVLSTVAHPDAGEFPQRFRQPVE
ncbi:hypothetical protein ACFQVA_42625 [Actinomadura keratinilytica]